MVVEAFRLVVIRHGRLPCEKAPVTSRETLPGHLVFGTNRVRIFAACPRQRARPVLQSEGG